MRFLIYLFLLVMSSTVFSDDEVIGFWKTINDRKGIITSIVAVYKFNNKVYGQVIIAYNEKTGDLIDTLYNPKQHIEDKEGYPFLCKSNLFWNLIYNNSRWIDGTVIDPRNGKKFRCQLWNEEGVLILRGSFGIFGLNQLFFPVDTNDFPYGFIIPDIEGFLPAIPEFQ
jgi:uncharacterized protein (DUF2147 family)